MNDASLKRIENLCAEARKLSFDIPKLQTQATRMDAEPFNVGVTIESIQFIASSRDVLPLVDSTLEAMTLRQAEIAALLARLTPKE